MVRLDGVEDLEELVRRHHAGLLRLAFVVCGDPTEAEDLVADAYARAWPRLAAGKVDEPLAYLRRAVVNGGATWRRRRLLMSREARRRVPAPVALDVGSALAERDALGVALRALPVEHRQVLGLRFVADLSEADTAAALGVPVGTVKSRTARALARLREVLSGVDPSIPAPSRRVSGSSATGAGPNLGGTTAAPASARGGTDA